MPLPEKYTPKCFSLIWYAILCTPSFKDFKTFVNADSLISVPDGHKHGTILKVDKKYLKLVTK